MEHPKRALWLERAERLMQLRNMLSLSRRVFCERLGLPLSTVSYWETPTGEYPGIEERGAKRVAYAIVNIGCVVTPEWILTGKGLPPRLLEFKKPKPLNLFRIEHGLEDMETFARNTAENWGEQYTWHRMMDNAMLPYVSPDDIIVAQKIPEAYWHDVFGHPHIPALIERTDGTRLIRFLGWADGDIILSPANVRSTLAINNYLLLPPKKIAFAASIVMHLRWGQRADENSNDGAG